MKALKAMIGKGLCVSLALVCAGCGSSDAFSPNIIEAAPVKIDAEYVMLNPTQVQCGVQEDLWESPVQSSTNRSMARLTSKGRDLKFAEDVSIGDLPQAYIQVRGDFPVKNLEAANSIKDGPEKDTKLVESKLGVIIQHTCFTAPLPMMGVRRGQFSQDFPPIVFYRLNNGWKMEKFVH